MEYLKVVSLDLCFFFIFINDLPEVISVCIKLFADDAKLYTTVDSIEKTQCLQENLGSAVEWADTWNMFYNDAKCHHLHIGSRDLGVNYVIPTYQGLTTLEKVTNEKDLGVKIDCKLNFRDHIVQKVNLANRNLGIIFRTFTYIDSVIFLNLYKSLVRPHLEYATQIWSPLYKKDKITIENVQRRATRLVKSVKHLPYPERLKKLGLPTLDYRRHVQIFYEFQDSAGY